MKEKRKIIYLSMFIAFIVISIAVGTYAFFDFGEINAGGDLPLGTVTGSSATFTAYSEGDIELNLNKDVMTKDVSSTTAAASNNSTIHIRLDGGAGNSSTTCTYDLIWVWDGEDQYKESTVELPYTHTDNKKYNYEFSVKVGTKETNLSNFTWNDNKAIIATKSINAAGGETKTDDYDVLVNFYNLPIRQNALSGKTYQGHIEVSQARCGVSPTIAAVAKDGDLLADAIKALYTEDGEQDLYYHDGVGTYTNANLEADDNSYRYAGANPNNFVCFAEDCTNYDNLYRIIGVFGGQVKLIKADFANSNLLGEDGDYSISTAVPSTTNLSNYITRGRLTEINRYYWNKVNQPQAESENSGKSNIWSYSELNKTNLNKNFVEKLESAYLSMIDDTEWIVSGFPTSASLPLNAQNVYKYEIAETCTDCGTEKETRLLSEPTKIGLMYASDYMYAALPNNWTLSRYDSSDATATQDYRAAIEENWMYLGVYEWTVSRNSTNTNCAFDVYFTGFVGSIGVDSNYGVRPVFYLKESIVYSGGAGTAEDPIRVKELSLSEYIVAQYTEDGVNNLYLHDGVGTYTNSDLEAGDNSYRYAGANPNNFVCFGDDCTDYDNLYRIIGVFDDQVKLIKADYANSNLLGTTGEYSNYELASKSADYQIRGKLTKIDEYYWNKINQTTPTNVWSYSKLNQTNLNTNYLKNIGNTYSEMIADMQWIISGGVSKNLYTSNAKTAYDYEIAELCPSCNSTKATRLLSEPTKIGLMYLSDYYYAADSRYWNLSGYNSKDETQDYRVAISENWIYLGLDEWTISPSSDGNNRVFDIRQGGWINVCYDVADTYDPLRPTFYLKSNVKFISGEGTASDPMRISM